MDGRAGEKQHTQHARQLRFIMHKDEHSLMFPTAITERAAFVQFGNLYYL